MKNHLLALLFPLRKIGNEARPTGGVELFISTNDFAVLYLPARWSWFFLLSFLFSFSAPFIHHLDLVLSNKTNEDGEEERDGSRPYCLSMPCEITKAPESSH
jgi:hypothetical protein